MLSRSRSVKSKQVRGGSTLEMEGPIRFASQVFFLTQDYFAYMNSKIGIGYLARKAKISVLPPRQ
jgi:hypothetical protein